KPFREVCARAAKRGVIVDSVYCGDAADAIAPGWREVAKLGEGEFAAIDQDRASPVVATPYDELMAKLSTSLDATYLPFGRSGAATFANQAVQDANGLKLGLDAAASRAATKASVNYRNGSWDLVDAYGCGGIDLAKLEAAELPPEMRKLNAEERIAYVRETAK